MVILLIVGLVGLCLAGLYVLEGATSMVLLWGAIGIACIGVYLVNIVKNKFYND